MDTNTQTPVRVIDMRDAVKATRIHYPSDGHPFNGDGADARLPDVDHSGEEPQGNTQIGGLLHRIGKLEARLEAASSDSRPVPGPSTARVWETPSTGNVETGALLRRIDALSDRLEAASVPVPEPSTTFLTVDESVKLLGGGRLETRYIPPDPEPGSETPNND